MFLAVDDKKPEEPKDDSKKKLKKTKSEISEPETQPPADQQKQPETDKKKQGLYLIVKAAHKL